MSFEEFHDGHHGRHLGYWKGMILAILNLYNIPMPPIKFQLNLTWFGRRWHEEFQNGPLGGHLGNMNGRTLAILNLCVIVMLHI